MQKCFKTDIIPIETNESSETPPDNKWVQVTNVTSPNVTSPNVTSPNVTSPKKGGVLPRKSKTLPVLSSTRQQSYPPHRTYHHRYKRRDKYPSHHSKRSVFCSNCGGKGHLFKECKKPIQSHGVIAVRPSINSLTGEPDIEVLLIRRRNTISYEAFVRGKYKHDELPIHLIRMTSEEKERITKRGWEDLYDEVCFFKNSKHYHRERKHAKEMYESINIPKVFDTTMSDFAKPEWEFPKGRKYSYESEKECAVREFREETNINNKNLILLDMVLTETFIGTNKRKYTNQYFVGVINKEASEPYIDPTSKNQISEIGDVEWVSFTEARSRIRAFHQKKINILDTVYNTLSCKIDFISDLHSKTTEEIQELYLRKKLI